MPSSNQLPTRPLGKNGPEVPRIGLGLMGASGVYGIPGPDEERLAFLDQAYEMGERFWDTADEYGDSEDLLGKWFTANPERRKDIFLATKFAVRGFAKNANKNDPVPSGIRIDSSPEYCKQAIEKSLKRLGLPFVDLFYVHRLDKVTPVEKTIQAMVELKNAGKINYIGMSECSAESLRRAYAVHPITAVQIEYSPFCLAIESPQIRLLETARELGVAVVCYSPLGNGLLSGSIHTRNDVLKEGDSRGMLPWLQEENLPKNMAIVDKIADLAKSKGITLAQMTLAWILAQGEDFFPIPGTKNASRLQENLGSVDVSVTSEDGKAVRKLADNVVGGRFQDMTGYAFGDTPPL